MNPVLRLIDAKKNGKPIADQVKRPVEFCRPRAFTWQCAAGMFIATSLAITFSNLCIRNTPKTLSGDWQKESEKLRRTGDYNKHVDPDEI